MAPKQRMGPVKQNDFVAYARVEIAQRLINRVLNNHAYLYSFVCCRVPYSETDYFNALG